MNRLKALAAALALLISGTAAATSTFQGLDFTFIETSPTTLTFEIEGTPSGDWTGVQYLAAFDLKGLGLDFSLVGAAANGPGANNLLALDSQLSASNLDCSKLTGQTDTACFDISPDVALGTLPFDFVYSITFGAPYTVDPSGIHLQIAFTDVQNGPKVGSLYSQDVPTGGNPPPPPPPPPPP